MKTEIPTETFRTVQFVGNYFCLTTSVSASSDEQAIANADALLGDYYGWDIADASNEITVKDSGIEV